MPSATNFQNSDESDPYYLYHFHHAPRPGLPRHFSSGFDAADVRLTRVSSLEDSISPLMLGKSKHVDDFSLDGSKGSAHARLFPRQSRRRCGKCSSLVGSPILPSQRPLEVDSEPTAGQDRPASIKGSSKELLDILGDISSWIEDERDKQKPTHVKSKSPASVFRRLHRHDKEKSTAESKHHTRKTSDASEKSHSLDQLEALLSRAFTAIENRKSFSRKPSSLHRRSTVSLRRNRSQSICGQSDDTDSTDTNDLHVASCDAVLDNSKTLSYTGGESQADLLDDKQISSREDEAWATFKYEIVRLAHTLKLKGWRKVSMDRSNEISVERLSGALTNAVYVVSPPQKTPTKPKINDEGEEVEVPQRPPPKLLLRIYGPNVDHLIDRDGELQILRRLARKRIGPRLLGTFGNGRFEEYLHAKTLQPQDLRVADTSKQIAKRMRELHEGVELLDAERAAGPFVWQNWDKWLARCEKLTTYIDQQVISMNPTSPDAASMKSRGLVCGVEWHIFRRTVEKYRKWVDERYGGIKAVKERLVFAHNDTQYGNILRLIPPGDSPLMLPANQHKQLVVIDFEYANANMPGFEFANHFIEWCYNYHDPVIPYVCNTTSFPSEEEQYRFVRSYVLHRPQFASAASSTPVFGPTLTSQSNQSTLSLARRSMAIDTSTSLSSMTSESRMPSLTPTTSSGEPGSADKDHAESVMESQIKQLLWEARLWRVACHAQWIAWGIVQATVAGLDENGDPLFPSVECSTEDGSEKSQPDGVTSPTSNSKVALVNGDDTDAEEEVEAVSEEFDYLSYAQDRALFFWGDCLEFGFIKKEELPEDLVARALSKVAHLK